MKKLLILILFIPTTIELMAQNYSDSLTTKLTNHFKNSDLPGFSVAIVSEDKVLYQKGFGFANKDTKKAFDNTTVQALGSVSKTVVGLALVKAIGDGKLTMDTEINDILPFQVINPFFKDSPILIRHLANHTSSISDTKHYGKSYVLDDAFVPSDNVHRDFLGFIKSHDPIELEEFLANILSEEGKWYRKKNFLKAKPGTAKEYANLNAALAAYIIEVATDTPFEEYTQTQIFSPLGMPNTAWNTNEKMKDELATPYFPAGAEVPRYKLITYPDGGLHSNTNDLSIYLQEIIKAYARNSTYLTSEYAKILLPGDNDTDRAFWGMGEESRNIGHSGSDPGVQTDLQFNADSKIGRIILTNVNAEDNDILSEQYREIHRILAEYESKLIAR
ncbi:MAG: serine hydrolase domain-containing protein [Bacteroidota bacterium]